MRIARGTVPNEKIEFVVDEARQSAFVGFTGELLEFSFCGDGFNSVAVAVRRCIRAGPWFGRLRAIAR